MPEVINMVDLSGVFGQLISNIIAWITTVFDLLDDIYLLPHVSLLMFIVAITVLSMIISAIFVLFDGSVED